MTKDEELAFDLALEALENNRRTHYYCEDTWYSCPKHEDGCANEAEGDECNCGADKANQEIDNAITAIKQARSAPVQEPVQKPVWIQPNHLQKAKTAPFLCRVEPHKRDDFVPLYTTPPAAQRQWVGLTLEQKQYLNEVLNLQGRFPIIDAIEAKLKEKNT